MNGALQQAEAVDPEWARKEHRRWWLLKVITGGVVIALGVGTVALVVSHNDAERITHVEKTVEHSACQEHPAGDECQQTKARSAEAANLRVSCIPFEKVARPGFLKRTRCPEAVAPSSASAGSPRSDGEEASSASTGHPRSGGTGGSEGPAAGTGHHAPAQGNGGGGRGAGSGAPGPGGTSSSPPSSTTTERIESTVIESGPEAPVAEGVGKLTESVGSTVEGLGGTVDGSVEGVEGTTCTLAKALCHE